QGDRVEVVLRSSHHAAARLEIFGPATTPVCDVAAGVLAGALEALAGRTYTVEEVECMAAGGSACRFRAVPAASGIDERPSESAPHGRITAATRPSGISAAGALPSGLRDGTLPGSTYGRLWSDFYARAALDFEVELPRSMGPKYGNVAPVVLAEAAHQGIFHGFARLLRSVEWTESVSPALSTTAHRLEALVSLAAHLGWGEWSIALLDPDRRLTMHVRSGYEAMYRLDRGLRPTGPTCHFARGAVAALMNLVSVGDVQTPPDVDQSLYNSVFRNPHSFRAIETRCQALGDAYCEIVANPLSPRGRFS